MSAPWAAVLVCVMMGGVFMFAGFSYLGLPHEEVVARIRPYTVMPDELSPLIATVLPWLEVRSGTARLMGF
jgi:hypothetical protein